MTDWHRLGRHLITDHNAVRKLFSPQSLRRLEQATRHGEQLHHGQVRLAIEASLPLNAVRLGKTPRQRALEVFAQLRVWDTAANSGVLVYLLVADRAVEIVADRGIHAKVGDGAWRGICEKMEIKFRDGNFTGGAQSGLVDIGALLAVHFPRKSNAPGNGADVNELPDAPVLL
jgi:uncharacterized membrane protein